MRWLLLLLSLPAFAQFTPPSGGGSGCGDPNCTVSGNLIVSGAATIGGTTTISTTLLGTSTSTYAALSLTENGTITGSPTFTQHAPIEINIHSASVNSRDAGLVFRCFGSGTSGCPSNGTAHDFFMGFDGDNVFIMGTQNYFSDGAVATVAFLAGTYPEIFDAVQIQESTGRNGTAELLITPQYAHTGPAIDIHDNNGPSLWSVDNPTGNTLIAGTVTTTVNGALSAPALAGTGTWITGGSATTNKPYALFEPAGTATTAWSTSGTGIGINAASGFSGNLIDAQVAAVSKFSVSSAGLATSAATSMQLTGANAYYVAAVNGGFQVTGRTRWTTDTDGIWSASNNAASSFTRLNLGPNTNTSYPALGLTSQTNPILKVLDANGGATADLQIGNRKATTGQRYVCIDTAGTLVSSATACVGT